MAYIGLSITPEDSEALTFFPGARLHVTLAHMSEPLDYDQGSAMAQTMDLVARSLRKGDLSIPRLEPKHYAKWNGQDLVVLVLEPEPITPLRDLMIDMLRARGRLFSRDYEWSPHISLGHIEIPRGLPPVMWPEALELVGAKTITRWSYPLAQRRG